MDILNDAKLKMNLLKKLLILLVFMHAGLFGQTIDLDIILVGSDIGDMKITRTVSGTKKSYVLESKTSVMFGARKDVYTSKMEFENNVLISSSIEDKKNGKMSFYTYVNRVAESGYKVQTEKGLSTVAGNILTCCYDIYYREAKEGESVFSERWGKFGTIKKIGDHEYKIVIPGGEDYFYTYENNKLAKMEANTFLGKCKFIVK